MFGGKAALAAAVVLTSFAGSAFAGDDLEIQGGGRGFKGRIKFEPPRWQVPVIRPPRIEVRPPRHVDFDTAVVTRELCIDGDEFRATVKMWRDECGKLQARVTLESCHRPLPDIEKISLKIRSECGDSWSPRLCRVRESCDRDTLVFASDEGERWRDLSDLTVDLKVYGEDGAAKARWDRVDLD